MATISRRLVECDPNDVEWTISFAFAFRRANSIQAAKDILLKAEPKFPKQAVIKYNLACYFCQLRDLEPAKEYLKRAFEIDPNWRIAALDDKDLEPLWASI
jgi:tetratricopeptide (TPR) repeat protein